MAQAYKVDKVAELKKYFETYKSYILTDYKGINVEKISQIRKSLRKLNSKMVVMKNTYAKIIVKDQNLPSIDAFAFGPTAVVFGNEEINEVVKKLFEFSKELPLVVKGGIAEGAVMDAKQLEAFSKLPGKKEMIAMVMATMNAPIQNFVYACNDAIGRFVRVVNALAESKKSAG